MFHIFYFADDEEDVNNMEKVMLEYATMDRELNHYIKAFEETINQVNYLFSLSYENIPLFKYYLLKDTNVTFKQYIIGKTALWQV